MTFGQINQGSGELEVYVDHTADITPELADEAAFAEENILAHVVATEHVYLFLGELLSDFLDRGLYRARGYDTFRKWADSADLNRLNYQTANNLIRIHKKLRPIFERTDLNIQDYPMSTLRAMLPLVGEYTDDDIIQIARDVHGLTVRDTNAIVKEKQGRKLYPEDVIFKAFVFGFEGDDEYQYDIVCVRSDGTSYKMGASQKVQVRDLHALKKFYGRHYEENLR